MPYEVPDPPPPDVLPCNRDAWAAWSKVSAVRRSNGFGSGGFAWGDAEPVLRLYGLWSIDTHRRLELLMGELRDMEEEEREARGDHGGRD